MPHPVLVPGAVAVITGDASGIGLAAARKLATLGLKVVVADKRGLDGVSGDIVTIETDVADRSSVEALSHQVHERFGGVDVLMNNAGVSKPSTALGGAWEELIGVNLWGVIHGTQAFVPKMTGRKEKPDGAWTAEQTVDFMLASLEKGDFYLLCPDNEVTRPLDEKRIAWAAGDIVENRPPLSRRHSDWTAKFTAFANENSK